MIGMSPFVGMPKGTRPRSIDPELAGEIIYFVWPGSASRYFLFLYPVLVLLSVFLLNVPACVSLCLAFPFQFSALITAWFSLQTPYCPSLHVCLFLVCLNLCQIVVGYPTFSLAYSFLILRHFFPAISVQRFASFNLSDILTPLKCTLVLCLSLGWTISSTRLIIFMYFSITY